MEDPSNSYCCSTSDKNYVVLVQNLTKSYGSNAVLRNVSMHVEEGTVYGLLGSSGSGKTSLLNCILNLRKWDSGEICVLGKKVEDDEDIDTRNVGFMPQDLGLYDQLSVKEMMKYFSRLYDMSNEEFNKSMTFLEELMKLPGHGFRKICSLSGGQKRRISLSLTLLHKPKLLILDEPTVGLDPLLRESLWSYLYNLTITTKTTIIITTHYIEEVKRANMVGLMRKGKLLLEEDPAILMRTHNTVILEEVVRKLCYADAQERRRSSVVANGPGPVEPDKSKNRLRLCCNDEPNSGDVEKNRGLNGNFSLSKKESTKNAQNELVQVQISKNLVSNNNNEPEANSGRKLRNSVKRIFAYSQVVLINILRNPPFFFLILMLPPFQLFTTGTVFGVEPKFTPIGVVNYELPNWKTTCLNQSLFDASGNFSSDGNCDLSMLSCQYLRHLEVGNYIKLVEYVSKQAAEHAGDKGDIQGYIEVPANFSQHLIERAVAIQFATDETIDGTTIIMHWDMTEYIKIFVVTMKMFNAFSTFVKELTNLCNFDLRLIDIPFHYRHPVYGEMNGSAQDYALPALIAGILFEISFCVTPLVLLNDIRCGTLERSKVAGLRFPEFMGGVFVTMTTMSIIQGIICWVSMEYVLDLRIHGNLFLYLSCCFVAVLCGGTFGLLIGAIFREELTVIISAIFILPILMLYVGILRPEEIIALPYKTVVYYFFPSAAIVKSFRFVINRGSGLFHLQVWPGILITLGWGAVFCVLTIIVMKRNKS